MDSEKEQQEKYHSILTDDQLKSLSINNALGRIKELRKSKNLTILDYISVLRVICNIRDDPTQTHNLRTLAEKSYNKAIKQVPANIKHDVESNLSATPNITLDETVLAQILTENQKIIVIRPLITALFRYLSGSKHQEHSHCFTCDNKEKPAVGYPAIMRFVHELQSGKKVWDKDLEQLFQRIRNCKNRNSCSECRALHIMFLMLRDPSNDRILYNVCRSAHDKSEFAGQVLVSFLRLSTVLGPESVLASVIESSPSGPMSVYISPLIESFKHMNAFETPDEERERIEYDKQMDALDFSFFLKHESDMYSKLMVYSGFLKEKGIEEKVRKTVEESMNPRTIEDRRLQLISLLGLYVKILRNPKVATTDMHENSPWASTSVMPEISVYIKQTFEKYLEAIPRELQEKIAILPDSPSSKKEPCVCLVCFDNIADSVLTCGHKLCGGCAGRILSSTCMCPTCRALITKVVCKEEICLGGLCRHCDSSKQSPATHCHIGCGHRICCNDCAIQQGDSEKKCPYCRKSSRLIKIFD